MDEGGQGKMVISRSDCDALPDDDSPVVEDGTVVAVLSPLSWTLVARALLLLLWSPVVFDGEPPAATRSTAFVRCLQSELARAVRQRKKGKMVEEEKWQHSQHLIVILTVYTSQYTFR